MKLIDEMSTMGFYIITLGILLILMVFCMSGMIRATTDMGLLLLKTL